MAVADQLIALCSLAEPSALAIARDLVEEHGLCLPAMASLGERGQACIPAQIVDPEIATYWHNTGFGDGDTYGSGDGDGGYVRMLGDADENVYMCSDTYFPEDEDDHGDGVGCGNTGYDQGDGYGFGE